MIIILRAVLRQKGMYVYKRTFFVIIVVIGNGDGDGKDINVTFRTDRVL